MKPFALPRRSILAGSLLSGCTLAFVLGAAPASFGKEIYLNQSCQLIQPAANNGFVDGFRVDYRRNLTVAGQSYWFSVARYQDGSAITCLSRPNYQQGKPLPFAELQTQFIREVKAETDANTAFRIQVAGGNGIRVPMTEYRLSLANPTRPTLSKLRSWRESR